MPLQILHYYPTLAKHTQNLRVLATILFPKEENQSHRLMSLNHPPLLQTPSASSSLQPSAVADL